MPREDALTQHDQYDEHSGDADAPAHAPVTPALFASPAAAGPDFDSLAARLADLAALPVAEHPALYADLHAELTAKLQATDR